jgi:hypothetical protein
MTGVQEPRDQFADSLVLTARLWAGAVAVVDVRVAPGYAPSAFGADAGVQYCLR